MLKKTPFVLLVLFPLFIFASCSQFRASDSQIAREFDGSDVSPTFGYLENHDRSVRYMVAGTDDQPRVLFIHGAPGSLDAYNPYFELPDLRAAAQLVSVDRPGYGYSDFGRTEPDLGVQADLIAPLLTPGIVVVGHSFGGSVAMRLAMDHPDMVGGLVLIAPSLSPEAQRRFFFNGPMERRAFNWLLPTAWKVANTETIAQIGNLEAMLPLWSNVTAPVHLIHGTRDGMVPIEHSLFAVDQLPRSTTQIDVLEGERHFILWSEVDRVTAAIRSFLP